MATCSETLRTARDGEVQGGLWWLMERGTHSQGSGLVGQSLLDESLVTVLYESV